MKIIIGWNPLLFLLAPIVRHISELPSCEGTAGKMLIRCAILSFGRLPCVILKIHTCEIRIFLSLFLPLSLIIRVNPSLHLELNQTLAVCLPDTLVLPTLRHRIPRQSSRLM
jgi:hypothetical protein